MHRKHLRATVGAVDVDVPVGTFVDGEYLIFTGGVIASAVVPPTLTGPGTAGVGQVATWADINATTLAAQSVTINGGVIASVTSINGIDPATWVRGPNGTLDNIIARYDGTTGKLIQSSVVTLDDSGNLSGVGTINGVALTGFVTGPASAIDNRLVRYDGTTGKLIQSSTATLGDAGTLSGLTGLTVGTVNIDNAGNLTGLVSLNGFDINQWVVGATTASINGIPRYSSTSGRAIKQSVLAVSDAGNVTGITALNNVDFGDIGIREGFPQASNPIACFGSTAGNYGSLCTTGVSISNTNDLLNVNNIQGANILSAAQGTFTNLDATVINGVNQTLYPRYNTGAGLPFTNEILGTDSTNPLVVSYRPVTIDSAGNIVTSGTINSVDIEAHYLRHLPGGADELTTPSSTWGVYDSLSWNGNGARYVPKYRRSAVCGGLTITTSAQVPSGAALVLAPRAESYAISWDFAVGLGDTGGNLEIRVSWSSGSGTAVWNAGTAALTSSVSNGLMSVSLASAPALFPVRVTLGLNGLGSSGSVSISFRKSSGVSATLYSNGIALAIEV